MKYLYEEVAYLKGLAEGLEISKETKEGKIIHKIIKIIGSFFFIYSPSLYIFFCFYSFFYFLYFIYNILISFNILFP